jgi:hypothetical protein
MDGKFNQFVFVNTAVEDPYITIGASSTGNKIYWKFGDDNLFPQAVAILNRKSTVHRGILKSKVRFIGGKGFTCDENDTQLDWWIKHCNGLNENLKDVTKKLIFDYKSFGNAYLEIVINSKRNFLNLYHQDATKCRLSWDKNQIILHHNWRNYLGEKGKEKRIPKYPDFDDTEKDGYLRSIIHLKEYEPEFENYGIMDWIAGLNVSAIAYKTDKWNISRLDNSFNSSGVLVVAGEFKSDKDYEDFKTEFKQKFTGEGHQGEILMLSQQPGQNPDAGTRFVPIEQGTEGDWLSLHSQSTDDLIIAHGWFRALSGLSDNTGFDTQRILNEYEVAMNTVISEEQEFYLNLYRKILNEVAGIDASSLAFVNRPPAVSKPPYMRIWEARKADGMEFDENSEEEKGFLATISQKKVELTI